MQKKPLNYLVLFQKKTHKRPHGQIAVSLCIKIKKGQIAPFSFGVLLNYFASEIPSFTFFSSPLL